MEEEAKRGEGVPPFLSSHPPTTSSSSSPKGGGGHQHPRTLSEALKAILLPNETAQALFRRARTKPFRTGLSILDDLADPLPATAHHHRPGQPTTTAPSSSFTSSTTLSSSSSLGTEDGCSASYQQQRRGVRGGDVVEVCGKAGSGKTTLLLQVVADAVLPPVWRYRAATPTSGGAEERRLELHGEGAGVVFYDNDLKFDVVQLERVLRGRIRAAVARQTMKQQQGTGAVKARQDADVDRRKRQRIARDDHHQGGQEERLQAMEWRQELEEELIEECLSRLTVFRCEDSLQFLATLQMTDEFMHTTAAQRLPNISDRAPSSNSPADTNEEDEESQSEAAEAGGTTKKPVEIKVLIIDSIGAFYNIDRHADGGFGYGRGGGFANKRGGGSRSRMNKIVNTLRQLVNAHSIIVFAAKGAPFGKLTRQIVLNPNTDPHQEFLGDVWQNFVKYRLLLVREEELGGRPNFWACINKPNLILPLPSTGGAGPVARVRAKLFPFTVTEEGAHFSMEVETERKQSS